MSPTNAPSLPSTPSPYAVEVSNLTIAYGAKIALRDVSLQFNSNSITAIIGPSGCGKSSLLMSLNRLSDLTATCRVSGRIQVHELDVLNPRTDVIDLRRRVGMIFQHPNPFPMSIRRNLELPLREHGLRDTALLNQRIEQALVDVGLWNEVKDRLDRSALALSGGQKQRLCLARALALNPQVILLDEPCNGLDPISIGIIEDLMLQLKQSRTLIVVTHNLAQARRVADHTVLLWSGEDGGRLIERGISSEFFDSPKHEVTAAYISGRIG